jgi:ankyrin repeat protein
MFQLLTSFVQNKNLINQTDQTGQNALFYSIQTKEGLPILQTILASTHYNLLQRDKEQNTPLHVAIVHLNYPAIELLVEKSIDIDSKNKEGQTPLCLAVKNGDDLLVQYLLENGADKTIKDSTDRTPLDWAKVIPYRENIIQLLEQQNFRRKSRESMLNLTREEHRIRRKSTAHSIAFEFKGSLDSFDGSFLLFLFCSFYNFC